MVPSACLNANGSVPTTVSRTSVVIALFAQGPSRSSYARHPIRVGAADRDPDVAGRREDIEVIDVAQIRERSLRLGASHCAVRSAAWSQSFLDRSVADLVPPRGEDRRARDDVRGQSHINNPTIRDPSGPYPRARTLNTPTAANVRNVIVHCVRR